MKRRIRIGVAAALCLASLSASLGEAGVKTGWQVHALCLMPNHFHLVVETPQSNLVAGMKWFLGRRE